MGLVLSRKVGQTISVIVPPQNREQHIVIEVKDMRGRDKCRLGFEAAKDVQIWRSELIDK